MARVTIDLPLYDAHYLRSILNSKKATIVDAIEGAKTGTSVYNILQDALETVSGLIHVVDSAIEDRSSDDQN